MTGKELFLIANLKINEELWGFRTVNPLTDEVKDMSKEEVVELLEQDERVFLDASLIKGDNGEIEVVPKSERKTRPPRRFPEIHMDEQGEFSIPEQYCSRIIFVLIVSYNTTPCACIYKVCNGMGDIGIVDSLELITLDRRGRVKIWNTEGHDTLNHISLFDESEDYYEVKEDNTDQGYIETNMLVWESVHCDEARELYKRSSLFGNSVLSMVDSTEVEGTAQLVGCLKENLPETIIIPDYVTSIRKRAFAGVRGVKNIYLGKNVKRIGIEAFSGLSGVTIKLNEGLEQIGELAFAGSTLVGTLEVPSTVKTIEFNAFVSSTIENIKVCGEAFEESEDGLSWLGNIPKRYNGDILCKTLTISENLAVKLLRFFCYDLDLKRESRKKFGFGEVNVYTELMVLHGEQVVHKLTEYGKRHYSKWYKRLQIPMDEAVWAIETLLDRKNHGVGKVIIEKKEPVWKR